MAGTAESLYGEDLGLDDHDDYLPSWELPPRRVLRNVFRRLPRNPDFAGATFICMPWLALRADGDSVVAEPQRLMPGLLLPEEEALDPASRCFLSLATDCLHDIAFPQARGARCVGAARGWLVMLRKGVPAYPPGAAAGTDTLHVVHPLLPRLEFRLPDEFTLFEIQAGTEEERHLVGPRPSGEPRPRPGRLVGVETDAEMLQRVHKADEARDPYIAQIALSCSPTVSGGDCVALCVYRHRRCLAAARPGDSKWTRIEVGWEYMEPMEHARKILSVAHRKGSFYAASYDGSVLRVDVPPAGSASPPRVEKFADAPPHRDGWSTWCQRWRLADDSATGGGLVFVRVERSWLTDAEHLRVFRWDEELGFWRRSKTLGGRALFVSRGAAFFADARYLPWCAGDCIYFADDERVLHGEDVAVRCYDMRRHKVHSVANAGPKEATAPPVWIMPFHE